VISGPSSETPTPSSPKSDIRPARPTRPERPERPKEESVPVVTKGEFTKSDDQITYPEEPPIGAEADFAVVTDFVEVDTPLLDSNEETPQEEQQPTPRDEPVDNAPEISLSDEEPKEQVPGLKMTPMKSRSFEDSPKEEVIVNKTVQPSKSTSALDEGPVEEPVGVSPTSKKPETASSDSFLLDELMEQTKRETEEATIQANKEPESKPAIIDSEQSFTSEALDDLMTSIQGDFSKPSPTPGNHDSLLFITKICCKCMTNFLSVFH
jgi:hypothetical protein